MLPRKSDYQGFKKNFAISTILLLLIISCSSSSPTLISPISPSQNFLSSKSTSTITTISTATLTPAPTYTLTPVPTTVTLPPSLTPLPTIPFDEIQNKFGILLATNGGCHLPCFWGMTPGETTVAELLQFTKQFTMPGFEMLDTGDGVYTFRYLTKQIKNQTRDPRWVVQFRTNREKIQSIDLIAETAQYNFPLSKILSDYGTPEKVFIGPEVFHALPMEVLYENQRILGSYYLYQNDSDKSLYCYSSQGTSQEVVTWASDENWHNFISK
ncbi:MAG: hypothetical protein ABI904_15390 [Chloroflexota bacterium]